MSPALNQMRGLGEFLMSNSRHRLSLLSRVMMIVAGCIHGAATHKVTADVTPTTIIQAWQQREQRIRTARVVWTQRRVAKSVSLNGEPPRDVTFEHTFQVWVDGPSVRLERNGPDWFRNGMTTELRDYSTVEVFSNGISKRLRSSKEGSRSGGVKNDASQLVHSDNSTPWPVIWFLRPFLFPRREVFLGDRTFLEVLPGSSDAIVVCGLTGSDLRLTVDGTKEFLVCHVKTKNAELDVQYRADPTYGIVPDRWTATIGRRDTTDPGTYRCQINELELNVPLPPETFQLTFPVGTSVLDANDDNQIVAWNGTLVPNLNPKTREQRKRSEGLILASGIVAFIALVLVLYFRKGTEQVASKIHSCLQRCWSVARVRFTLVEVLLVFLVLSPVLAIWKLTGVGGIRFLILWVVLGIASYIAARQLRYRRWRVTVPIVTCVFCALVIATADGIMTALAPSRVMSHLTAGGLIGIACGVMASVRGSRADEVDLCDTARAVSGNLQKPVSTTTLKWLSYFRLSFLHFLVFVVSFVITWQLGLGRQQHYVIEYAHYVGAGVVRTLGFPVAIIPWNASLNPWGMVPNSLLWGAAIYNISKRIHRHKKPRDT